MTIAKHQPPEPSSSSRVARGLWGALVVVVAMLFGGAIVYGFGVSRRKVEPQDSIALRDSPVLFKSIKDLARLETTELYLEKVIDLTDRQSRLWGMVEVRDALLLVAPGYVSIGVDLSKLTAADILANPESRVVSIRLPDPEVFSARLDEAGTYVYSRNTDVLARRNELLESRARQEAIAAIRNAAMNPAVMDRAKQQAERALRALLLNLGAREVTFVWHTS